MPWLPAPTTIVGRDAPDVVRLRCLKLRRIQFSRLLTTTMSAPAVMGTLVGMSSRLAKANSATHMMPTPRATVPTIAAN